jgi:polysaccharide deacetylase 2 family uncharacterized protein YibQ
VASDELNAPLGQSKAKISKRPKLPIGAPQLLAGLLGLSGVVLAVWAAVVDDPLGGEPLVVVSAKPPAGETPAATPPAGPQDAKAAAAGAQNAVPPGAQTVTIIDGSSGQRQEVVIPGRNGAATGKANADAKLLETSRHGAIPRIGPDGTRPSIAYAQTRALKPIEKTLPQIALVIGSVGISASGSADALSKLPPAVSLALAPYGADLEKLAERARSEGHEVLLQVPMEPFDYPDNDPGPQTLLTTLNGDQNVDRLHWLMSRFQGYVGLLNNMGARFTISEQALGPVLRDTAKRGLIYVDSGTAARSVAGQVASNVSLPFAKTDVLLDAAPTPAEIDRALGRLEALARENGSAVGLATAQSATIARLAEWAQKVESRGFVLVPITMIAAKAKSS